MGEGVYPRQHDRAVLCELVAAGDAGVGRVLLQLLDRVDSGGDGNDSCADRARGLNVGRRVSDETDACVCAEAVASFNDAMREDVFPQFVLVAERSERKVVGNSGSTQLVPGNEFEIARCNAQKFVGGAKRFEQCGNVGT